MTPEALPEEYLPPLPRRPIAWVTWFIVGTTAAVFVLQLATAHFQGDDLVAEAFAFTPQAMVEGHYWTLVTYAWVHAVELFDNPDLFWLHIAANMIPLICLGPALEDFIGHARFLGLYLGGAIVSALTWYFIDGDSGPGIVGASGAVFALIVAAGTAAPRASVTVYVFFVLPVRMSLRMLVIGLTAFEGLQVVFGWWSGIAHWAHLGGAAFGFLYMSALRLLARRRAIAN